MEILVVSYKKNEKMVRCGETIYESDSDLIMDRYNSSEAVQDAASHICDTLHEYEHTIFVFNAFDGRTEQEIKDEIMIRAFAMQTS